jgi:hypothetical protein
MLSAYEQEKLTNDIGNRSVSTSAALLIGQSIKFNPASESIDDHEDVSVVGKRSNEV